MIQTEKQLKYLCILQITWIYEYFTNEYLDLKPSTVEQAKFEYYPLCKIISKEFKEEKRKKDF